MGFVVPNDRLAAAFKSTSGKTMYALFEENNRHNAIPNGHPWSCHLIGELSAVMRHIMHAASYVVGGAIQDKAGRPIFLRDENGRDITAEGYMATWLRELANPAELADCDITLLVEDSWSATVAPMMLPWVKHALCCSEREADARALENGQPIVLSLYDDAELVAAIYDGVHCDATRIIRSIDSALTAPRNPMLGNR